MAKLQAYELQDAGLDTVEANERLGFKADHRDFTLPGEMLKALGIRQVRLLSNNPGRLSLDQEREARTSIHIAVRAFTTPRRSSRAAANMS